MENDEVSALEESNRVINDFLREKAGNLTDTQDLNFTSPLCNSTLDCNKEKLFIGASKLYPLPTNTSSDFSRHLAYSVIALSVAILLLSCLFLLYKFKAKAGNRISHGQPTEPQSDGARPPRPTSAVSCPVFSASGRMAHSYDVHFTTQSKRVVENSRELQVTTTHRAPPDIPGTWTVVDV